MRSRLYLVTPRLVDLATFPAEMEAALAGGDIASLLIAPEVASDMALQRITDALTPIAQAHGVAVMVANDTRAAGRAKADGIHVDGGIELLREVCTHHQPKLMVGAANLKGRHDAMVAAETGADYVFFGMLDRPEEEDAHPKSLDLGEWWASMFEIPCVVLAGLSPHSVTEAAETGADFIAVRDAVWAYSGGPRAAVAELNRRLDLVEAERAEAEGADA